MRFQVDRVSRRGVDTEPPCPEAVKGLIQSWDYRTFATPAEYDALVPRPLRGKKWHDNGTEHGYWEHGGKRGIKRRLRDAATWYVELVDLAALMEFKEAHGDLILTDSHEDRTTPLIAIYDGWYE